MPFLANWTHHSPTFGPLAMDILGFEIYFSRRRRRRDRRCHAEGSSSTTPTPMSVGLTPVFKKTGDEQPTPNIQLLKEMQRSLKSLLGRWLLGVGRWLLGVQIPCSRMISTFATYNIVCRKSGDSPKLYGLIPLWVSPWSYNISCDLTYRGHASTYLDEGY